jgi:deoxycytidylate deaminase
MESNEKNIVYPYLPKGRTILYVPENNKYMVLAKEYAKKYRSNLAQPSAVVIVKNDEIIGIGSIGNNPAHIKGCVRVILNMPTGQGYELCEGCDPKFHSEPSAINDAKSKGNDTTDADLYMWGHWWCCEPCWNSMISAGIKNVYHLENSEVLFNKSNPDNIVGKQFK